MTSPRHSPSLQGLYAITDDHLLPDDRLDAAAAAVLRGGARLLQYRSKLEDRALRAAQAERLRKICADFAIPLIVNDDIDLCLAIGAAGVHLGQQDGSVALARRRLGPEAIIGVSCHGSLELALEAQQSGASYVAFGRFFPSRTKPAATHAPLSVLEESVRQLAVPVVAIGGINPQNGPSVIAAGTHMLAAIDFLFAAPDPESRARQLAELFEKQPRTP
ncbi:MAG: hypothetical protein RLZZ385_1837 [Pseudomonadota bacterium]|jgi:thiamine-phosphate pyrophosphorylase